MFHWFQACFGSNETGPQLKSLDDVARHIRKGTFTSILTLAGAGISTAAGIPDFRSPSSGLYDNLRKYELTDPQSVFDIHHFRSQPEPFFEICKEVLVKTYEPTFTHYFIKALSDKGVLLRHYTQNVDGLERKTGLSEEKFIEAHGRFETGHCMQCRKDFNLDWMRTQISESLVPKCDTCGGVVKPDVVFFGENLPSRFFRQIADDVANCDLIIVFGTSLAVEPFASVVARVDKRTPRVYINRTMPAKKKLFDVRNKKLRDVIWLGECDEGSLYLAERLDLGDDLKQYLPVKKDSSDETDDESDTEQNPTIIEAEPSTISANTATNED